MNNPLLFIICICFLLLNGCDKDDYPEPVAIEIISGESMNGVAGEELKDEIVIRVLDESDNPISNVVLFCEVLEGSVANQNPVTDDDGTATISWKLGPSEQQSLYIYSTNRKTQLKAFYMGAVSAFAALPVLTDVDGNVYEVVRIGRQIWMAENLKTTRYSDGTPIDLVESKDRWTKLAKEERAYCYYDNNRAYGEHFGYLYNWMAVSNGEGYSTDNPSGIQGISPEGWHIPSDAEWRELGHNLGGVKIAGSKMKYPNSYYWKSEYLDINNSSGFNALSAGRRYDSGSYLARGEHAYFWSTSENCHPCGPAKFWLSSDVNDLYFGGTSYFNSGLSVRCIMDYK
ncbi:hypothetical protein EYV94_21390 [Puteibacter caeruleilacunae]|nr:hypothetical protein EYV94_21390 [Puteibacter caeruleilacunae]